MSIQRDNPYANSNFVVDVGRGELTGFCEVSLPDAGVEVIEYREGADKQSASRKLPGRVRYGNLVLRRGVTGATDLYEWWKAIREGGIDRRNVTIVLRNEAGDAVLTWRVRNAWPVRYGSSQLRGDGNEVVVETLELTHEGVELE